MLKWETVLDTTPDDITQTTHMAMEPNNALYQYHMDSQAAWDRHVQTAQGDYTDLPWSANAQSLTNHKVRRIGIKHFPQIGAIGFWTLLNEERSKILAPVHNEIVKYAQPSFTVEDAGDTFIFRMSSPEDLASHLSTEVLEALGGRHEDLKYKCFRIILRLGQFAVEYVTYEELLEVPKPITTGTYDIYCVGYVHEGEAVSEDSQHYSMNVKGTQEAWPGPDVGADLYITDIEILPDGNIQFMRSDGYKETSDSVIVDIYPTNATFQEDGKLKITLNNGTTIVTDNVVPGSGESYVTVEQMEAAIKAAINDSWEAEY